MAARHSNIRPQLRLATRFAVTTLIALLGMHVLNSAVFFLLPPPQSTIYEMRWLTEQVFRTANTIFAADETSRSSQAERIGEELNLRVRWHHLYDAPPVRRPPPHWPPNEENLRSKLTEALGKLAREVRVVMYGGPPPHFPPGPPRQIPAPRGELASSEPRVPLEAVVGEGFEIAIEGQDGTWLTIGTHQRFGFGAFIFPWLATSAGTAICIFLLSVWTAKRSLQPLERLTAAAEKLGRAREAVPVNTAGLREFEVIAHALNGMQERIKRFLDERTHVLAAISHDMRTSLTRLRLASEELDECSSKSRIICDIEEMEQMISATLTFAGDDLKRERSECVDVASLLITLCDSFADRGHSTTYSGPDHAVTVCQSTAIKRAFVNLIDNAIKYGKCADVSLSACQNSITVTILDRGPGIPPDMVEAAFQPFRRLESSRSRSTGGVGLGLAIARDVIQGHGGDIQLTARAGSGLEARIRLPIIAP